MSTAVITGAGRGLGRLIAQGLAKKGYTVLVTDIDEAAAAETARQIGGNAWSMRQDVRDAESHRSVARAAIERGPLTVWVNNAGVLWSGDFWDMGEDEVRRHIDVNVLGVIWGTRAAIDSMERGQILNIASISSHLPTPGLAVYGASKHAVLGFSLSVEGELRHANRPIRVSALCPDAIDTDMVRQVADREASNLLFSSGKLLVPEDVAERAVALIEHPRPMATYPRGRAFMAHVSRPFPSLGLKALGYFRKVGERNRKRRV